MLFIHILAATTGLAAAGFVLKTFSRSWMRLAYGATVATVLSGGWMLLSSPRPRIGLTCASMTLYAAILFVAIRTAKRRQLA